ncbi:RICIN domain-containing protein [Streptomyces olivoreticuli]|uniref:RICIN domain-containing protein n=1 Tax=Streptomyces olivoreticuli TaxID=68246 RepID=UPI002658137C|nr:RICIN domain-containing protein [Streptomyces olivoreticuli]WKK27152.1 RICIN domain-containing protein [Streptomyces olivoreticuli]
MFSYVAGQGLRALPLVLTVGLLVAAQSTRAAELRPAAAASSPASPASIVGDGQYHSITNGGTTSNGSHLALEVEGQCSSQTGYADINVYDASHASQQWKFFLDPDGTANIQDSCDPSLALTAPTYTGGPATLTHRDTSNITPQQEWQVTQDSTGAMTITSAVTVTDMHGVQSHSVLDTCGTWAAGSTVVVVPSTQSTTQKWTVLS